MTRSLRLLPLPVEAALPPKAIEIAVRIADLPPTHQVNRGEINGTYSHYVQRGNSSFLQSLQSNVDDT